MEVKNAVMPNEEQIKEFSEQGEDKPIYMVNLLKFKEKANYPDKRETDLTGEEAYAIYAEEVAGHLEKVGGKPLFGKIKLRKDESKVIFANIKKIKKQLNWKPRVNFEEGLKKTLKFYDKNKKD